ncbi:hypothetical protein E2C01_080373 [Portunus trituberculatus]|uniref:Uncharacterized protein n=1 Tax=Portunus trituberculatus TaxID=210409 RepID=A0A5B7ITB0_PORTR|nr:hypothetical protein [Portunus trituberculatus]
MWGRGNTCRGEFLGLGGQEAGGEIDGAWDLRSEKRAESGNWESVAWRESECHESRKNAGRPSLHSTPPL